MLLRISTLATGRTGVQEATLAAYVGMLNAGIAPVVHSSVRSAARATWRRCPTVPSPSWGGFVRDATGERVQAARLWRRPG